MPLEELHCEENPLLSHLPVHSIQEEEVLSLKEIAARYVMTALKDRWMSVKPQSFHTILFVAVTHLPCSTFFSGFRRWELSYESSRIWSRFSPSPVAVPSALSLSSTRGWNVCILSNPRYAYILSLLSLLAESISHHSVIPVHYTSQIKFFMYIKVTMHARNWC